MRVVFTSSGLRGRQGSVVKSFGRVVCSRLSFCCVFWQHHHHQHEQEDSLPVAYSLIVLGLFS